MKKNGMTLIELLAVIAIIAIITLMIAPDIINIRERSIKSTLKNKINRIENAALRYANDNLSLVPSNFDKPSLNYSSDDSKNCMKTKSDSNYCAQYCLSISVNALIQEGYLTGDSNEGKTITHPLTNKDLNDLLVCIRYDSDKIVIGKNSESLYSDTSGRKLIAYIYNETEELFSEFSE